MRIGLILLPLSLCAAPALAQAQADPPQPQAIQLPPDTAERIASAMQSLSKAAQDLAGRRDPQMDRQVAEARPQIEHTVQAVNKALPEITEDLRRAQKAVERAIANMPDPNYPKR